MEQRSPQRQFGPDLAGARGRALTLKTIRSYKRNRAPCPVIHVVDGSVMKRFLLLGLTAAGLAGCTSASTSNTARSATEQILISNAVDQSLDKMDFRPFAGKTVYFEEKYIDCVDKNYVISSIRHRLLKAGAQLADKADAAEVVIEARSGGIGTSHSDSFVGVPEVVLPGMMTIPELRLATRTKQTGVAKIGIVAYDAKTRSPLGPGGIALSSAQDNNWYVFGVGPYQSGNVRNEVQRATTGNAAVSYTNVPPVVAFASPRSMPKPPDAPPATQYADAPSVNDKAAAVSLPDWIEGSDRN